jgi:predicted KAP-like P-loop ATPase
MSDTTHRWSSDREGRCPDDDKLGRLEFAQRVAKELCGWRNKESLVVSLNGDWGSGKTTLINLILYYIEEQSKAEGKNAPLVVRFNPWQWSGQDLISHAFFSEIGKKFRTSPAIERERAKRLLKVWEKFRDVSLAGGEPFDGLGLGGRE